jgi:hypothetical protein
MTQLLDNRHVVLKKYCRQCDVSVHGNTKTCQFCGATKFIYVEKSQNEPEFSVVKKVDTNVIQSREQKFYTKIKTPSRRNVEEGLSLIKYLIWYALLFGFLFLLFGKSLMWFAIIPLAILGIVFFYLFWLYGLAFVLFLFFLPFSIGEKYNLRAFTWILAILWWILYGSAFASLVEWFWYKL